MADNKCPKCGFVMVEEFNYKDGPNGITLAIPTGNFSCITCKPAEPPPREETRKS